MFVNIKRSLLHASKGLGISRLIANSAWRRDRLLVLCYHGVSLHDEHEWNPLLYVSPQTLEARLQLLRDLNCHVLPLDEATSRLYRGDLPERAVALTFDDGYFDYRARAFPLLSAYGYPSTVYLTTKRVEHNRPIVGLLLSYVLWKQRGAVLDGRGVPGLGEPGLATRTAAERLRITERVEAAARARGLSPAQKDDLAREIACRLGADYDSLASARLLTLMNPAEVSDMAARGVDFQLHTHRHRTPEDPEQFAAEIRINGERIEAMTGKRPSHFCYPSGVYRASYLPVLQAGGVVSATTCERGLATAATHPLLMPRLVDTDLTSEVEISGWISGAAAWLPQRIRPGALVTRPFHDPVGPSPLRASSGM
jgi:peptidoglycan/xylan/chitin deacetylase (PgdA/CDA1 family)